MNAVVELDQVNMHYRTGAYRMLSIKESVFNFLARKKSEKQFIYDVHSLKNMSFKVQEGERIALLGHNGAGKSTLLKVIANIYPISDGKLNVVGKVRSLFELSTGFEPEATGIENIIYRGLLLGQSPKYMRKIRDEIIEFADIGEFINYPLKTYSAGMQVRLAFAISTMIEGNILLLDEILGAGDANFIEKAKARILSLIEKASIMFLASHDLVTIKDICTRGLVIEHGNLMFDGPVNEAVDYYKQLIAKKE